jgi:hypothetical protein
MQAFSWKVSFCQENYLQMNFKSAIAVMALSAVCATAHAWTQQAEAISSNYFYYSTSSGVSVSASGLGYYLVGTYATGDAANYNYGSVNDGNGSGYTFTYDKSFAGPGAGVAEVGEGVETYLFFTNDTNSTQYFQVLGILDENQYNTAGGECVGYGGIQEFGGSYFYGFNTVTLDGPNDISDNAYNWTVQFQFSLYTGYWVTGSEGGFDDSLAPYSTIEVGIWTSDISHVQSPPSTPAPAAVAPFAVGLLGAIKRRRK